MYPYRLLIRALYRFLQRIGPIGTLCLAAAPAFAAAGGVGEMPGLAVPVGSANILDVVVSLIVVIGAIMICGWLYRRSQGLRGPAGDVFRIVASQALGPKERVVVIEVAGKQLVLGMTTSQISTLHVFDEPVVQKAAPRSTGGAEASFAERFKSILRGSNGK